MLYRVTDYTGACTVMPAENESEAIQTHLATFGLTNLKEPPVVELLEDESADELETFQNLMRYKWLKGREKYTKLGRQVYNEDTIVELQKELLDVANYSSVLFWELENIRETLGK